MILFRTATLADNKQLLELTRLTPMDGGIQICIERGEDFFSLLNKRGQPHVIVAEIEGKVVGCVSIVKEEMILLNEPVSFYYLCDLKVHPGHRNKKIATMLCHEMHNYLITQNAEWLSTIAAKGNHKVMPIIKGKAGILNEYSESSFSILHILTKKNTLQNKKYSYSSAECGLTVMEMYKEFYKRYVLHPATFPASMKDCNHIVAYKEHKPVSAISLYDPIKLKQMVITNIPWHLHITLGLMKILKPLLNLPPLPKKSQPVKVLYIKAFSFLPGYEDAFISLIQHAKNIAFQRNYTFLSLAIHEKDHLIEHLKKLSRFTFKSSVMICSLKNNTTALDKIKEGNILEDFSIV